MTYEQMARHMMEQMPKLRKPPAVEKIGKFGKGEFLVMHSLHMAGGKMLTKDLSKFTCVSPARITAVIDSLEKKGFARREAVENDRRKIQVVLCDKGLEMMDMHKTEVLERTIEFFKYLGKKDSEELIRLLDRSIEFFGSKEEEV